MAIVTNISTNHRLPIIMKAKASPQAKSRVKIPSMITGTKGTRQIKLLAIPIIDSPPNPCPFEILENPSEKPVLSLLLGVNTTRPITHVTVEAEIGGVEEEAGVEEAGAADGEFVEGKRGICGGEKIGRDIARTLSLPTEVGDERREFDGNAGKTSPISRIVFQFPENVEDDIISE
ncbi:hypothetical protein SESBI_20352 [Sesbania bispinosa]|nr:hypothetical protein SESBI_20352 [Sesbania bispinosa]